MEYKKLLPSKLCDMVMVVLAQREDNDVMLITAKKLLSILEKALCNHSFS